MGSELLFTFLVGFLAVVVFVVLLCLFVLYAVAPLVLYFIHSRVGETNELLRCILQAVAASDRPRQVPTQVAPPPTDPSLGVPTFRMLK